MALSKVQKGMIGQMEFIKLGTMGSKGALDYASPFADDDARDHEIHRRGRFGQELAVQTKVRTRLRRRGRAKFLEITILIKAERLVSSSMYWYFFALLDRRTMRFGNPCFLVPSSMVHRICFSGNWRGWRRYTFVAAVSPDSRDRWVTYRVETYAVGGRLLQILSRLERTDMDAVAHPASIRRIPGVLIVRRRKGPQR